MLGDTLLHKVQCRLELLAESTFVCLASALSTQIQDDNIAKLNVSALNLNPIL
ncbi:hypothetical protein CASFOL_041503 [Castilleja foliolosa]|uniref:Uncharacterized protein n=1 Tax=Castilleja foliolosa TaxID=1961234 RepID=A0ABD3BCE6_9LAMI